MKNFLLILLIVLNSLTFAKSSIIGKEIKAFQGNDEEVLTSIKYSSDEKKLLLTNLYGIIKVLDIESGEIAEKGLIDKGFQFNGVSYSSDGIHKARGTTSGVVEIYNSNSGEYVSLLGHKKFVWSVAYSPSGQNLASASWDGTIKIWDSEAGTEIKTLIASSDMLWCITYNTEGNYLISGGSDNLIKIWDAISGTTLRTLVGHTEAVLSLAVNQNFLASGSTDKTIKIWNLDTGEEIITLKGHNNPVMSLSFSPDGKYLASISKDEVKVWIIKE